MHIFFIVLYTNIVGDFDKVEMLCVEWGAMVVPTAPQRLYRSIGEAVRTRRRALDLTQQKLADRLGISRASLANIEVGRQRILVHHLYSLARELGVEVPTLLPTWPELVELKGLDDLDFSADVSLDQARQLARILREQEATTDTGDDNETGPSEEASTGSPE